MHYAYHLLLILYQKSDGFVKRLGQLVVLDSFSLQNQFILKVRSTYQILKKYKFFLKLQLEAFFEDYMQNVFKSTSMIERMLSTTFIN